MEQCPRKSCGLSCVRHPKAGACPAAERAAEERRSVWSQAAEITAGFGIMGVTSANRAWLHPNPSPPVPPISIIIVIIIIIIISSSSSRPQRALTAPRSTEHAGAAPSPARLPFRGRRSVPWTPSGGVTAKGGVRLYLLFICYCPGAWKRVGTDRRVPDASGGTGRGRRRGQSGV